MVHGVEVWDIPRGFRPFMIRSCDRIMCVSEFTRSKLLKWPGISPRQCVTLNNCLDPYLKPPVKKASGRTIRESLGFHDRDILMFTLARLRSAERYKGYDRVMNAMAILKDEFPDLKYVIAGHSDQTEEIYIRSLINEKRLQGRVLLSGFINEDELAEYFAAMDFYIMPSTGEGFGLVFIEALHFGLPVIAGNRDGSADAVDNGRLGILADPYSVESIASAIRTMIHSRDKFQPSPIAIEARFGYAAYRPKLFDLLSLQT